MADSQGETLGAGRSVLVADPRSARRQQLAWRAGRQLALEAASLCEAFPLAEQMVPDVLALSVDFLAQPEFEGLLRLADMLGSRIVLYSSDGRPPARGTQYGHLPCVPMEPGDDIAALLARLSDRRSHLADDPADARLPDLILLGASTGGIAAVEAVLVTFPADCPPTLVVQHIRDGYVPGLVRRLDGCCRPRVIEAVDGDRLRRGTVYFAADAARHLTVAGLSAPRCALIGADPRHGHRPAVDPLFESALPWAPGVAAALLTGMGTDGALGLGALRQAGAHTIAQDRATCIVWGMPRAAVESGAATEVLAIDRIGPALLSRRARPKSPPAREQAR